MELGIVAKVFGDGDVATFMRNGADGREEDEGGSEEEEGKGLEA